VVYGYEDHMLGNQVVIGRWVYGDSVGYLEKLEEVSACVEEELEEEAVEEEEE